MNIGVITPKGVDAINNAIASNGVFLTVTKAKLNNSAVSIPVQSVLTDLPAPIFDGYINSVIYDNNNKALVIQAIFDGEHPEFQYNSVGIYDHEDNLLFYSREHRPIVFFSRMVIRYYIWIPLYQNITDFSNVRIMLPENKVVHHVYEFSVESMYWRAQHNLLTPFVQFQVYDWHGQIIPQSEYNSYVTPGFVHIAFKTKGYRGFISVIGEGYSMSIMQGEFSETLSNPYSNYETQGDDNIPWITGTLLDG